MRRFSLVLLITNLLFIRLVPAYAQHPTEIDANMTHNEPVSAFLPQVGQTLTYRYSDTINTPKGPRSISGTLTLTASADDKMQATIAVDGRASHTIDFHVESNGALEADSIPERALSTLSLSDSGKTRNSEQNEQRIAAQALLQHLSLASRISAHPGEDTSFPAQVWVPWANGPVNPILHVKSTDPDSFVADGSDTTSVNPPQQRDHGFLPLGLGFGAGLIGGAIGGTPGRIVGISLSATSLVVSVTRAIHAGPVAADIKLHISGQIADGHLRELSGIQEETLHGKKNANGNSEKWSIVAETPSQSAL